MVAPMTLTEFLLARIAEDEEVAREAAVAQAHWEYAESYGSMQIQSAEGTNITCDSEGLTDSVQDFAGPHIARHDPARVLAEVEAKRRIVEEAIHPRFGSGQQGYVLLVLAAVYADHPGYREEWKP